MRAERPRQVGLCYRQSRSLRGRPRTSLAFGLVVVGLFYFCCLTGSVFKHILRCQKRPRGKSRIGRTGRLEPSLVGWWALDVATGPSSRDPRRKQSSSFWVRTFAAQENQPLVRVLIVSVGFKSLQHETSGWRCRRRAYQQMTIMSYGFWFDRMVHFISFLAAHLIQFPSAVFYWKWQKCSFT